MSRKRINQEFHIGKNISKNDAGRKSLSGASSSNLDTYNKYSGKFVSRRKYNQEGKAYVDIDVAHKSDGYDHAHDIDVTKVPPRSKEHRPLSKKERREINKAKRKRRFWR